MDGARSVSDGFAVDDVHVAAEVGLLDGAEAGLGLDDQPLRARGALGRRRCAAPAGAEFAVDHATGERRRLQSRSGPPAFSVADVMRLAGASAVAGRSSCTF